MAEGSVQCVQQNMHHKVSLLVVAQVQDSRMLRSRGGWAALGLVYPRVRHRAPNPHRGTQIAALEEARYPTQAHLSPCSKK